jgi:hypothetical protein
MEPMISHRAEPGMEEPEQKGKTLEALSPQQQISRRRGRPKKNKEVGETRTPDKPHARSVAEKLLMCVVRLEPVEATSQESRSRMRGMDVAGTNDQELSQQLKQAKLAIVELYQENRELRQQLVMKTIEVSAA